MIEDRTPIVLLDPFRDEREMYAHYLEDRGFDVTMAEDPAHALRVATRARRLGAIVTRIRLDDSMDGVEFTRRVKSDRRTRRIPVVVISTLIQPEFRQAAEAAGCDRFLLLPCLPADLAAALESVIQPARPRHKLR